MRSLSKLAKEKGQMGMLIEFVLLVAVIAIVTILVTTVNDDVREDLVTGAAGCNATSKVSCGTGYNATLDADTAIGKIPKNLKILATAVVFAVIIYVIMRVIPMANVNKNSF